jgi:hypothetical protein
MKGKHNREGIFYLENYYLEVKKLGTAEHTHYATSRNVTGSIPDEVIGFFNVTYSFQPYYGPRVDSAANRNEYQESSWG